MSSVIIKRNCASFWSYIPVSEVCVELASLVIRVFSTWMDGGCEISIALLEGSQYSLDHPSDTSSM